MKDIVSNCFLCEEHSLHVIEQEGMKLMQCIHCGYSSSDKFLGTKEEDKKHIVYDTGHSIPFNSLVKESIDWLEKYLN